MSGQATREDIILQERVKLLRVVVDKRRYKAGSEIQWKKWTKRITILRSPGFPSNACLEHFPKDAKPPLCNGSIESLDDTIVGIKYVAKAKKRNAIEIMFDYHSLLVSFETETAVKRWVEELRRIANPHDNKFAVVGCSGGFIGKLFIVSSTNQRNYYPMLLTTTINDMMKQGDYVLVPEPEQLLVYDAHTRALAWKWNLTQIQKFQHRRMTSEVEITIGSKSAAEVGSCVFFGQRLERFCDSLTEYARNLALKPLGKYTVSKSSTTLASDASHTHAPTGEKTLLKPSQDTSIEKRASYTNGQISLPGTRFGFGGNPVDHPVETELTKLHISSSSQQKSNDRDALLCDTD